VDQVRLTFIPVGNYTKSIYIVSYQMHEIFPSSSIMNVREAMDRHNLQEEIKL